MTLFPYVSRRLLGAIGLVFLCCWPVAYAAELEGTMVPLDSSVPAASPAPVPVPAPEADVPAIPATEPDVDQAPAPVVIAPDRAYGAVYNDQHAADEFERRMEKLLKRHNSSSNIDLSQFVPITAIIVVFGGPFLLIGFLIAKRYRNKQLHQQSLNDNIEKLLAAGRDIPVEMLCGESPKTTTYVGNRDKGIRNICLGTGVLIFLSILAGLDIGAIGLIWIALGVSQVLIWHLNQPKAGPQREQRVEQQD